MRITPKFRALGPAILVALAISAVAASAAQAAPQFHVQEPTATITGSRATGESFFSTSVGKLKCTKSSFTGFQEPTTSTTMTLTPEYENCTFLGLETTIKMNGCYYVFHLVQGEGSNPPTALMDIVCPKEKEITFEAGGCVVHIEPQTGLSHVVFDNQFPEGSPSDMLATITVTGMKYTLTTGCPGINKNVTLSSGEYKETLTVRADDSNGKLQALWVE
jgi:hypothetical protein